MKKQDALGKWSEACAAIQIKGAWVRNGNWLPISDVLRHKDCDTAEMTVVGDGQPTILLVVPAEPPKELPRGKSASRRPAFHLFVT